MLWPLLCTARIAHDICVEHIKESVGSVQFCEDLSLAGEGHLSHSDPFLFVDLVSSQAGPAGCYHKCSSEVHQPSEPAYFQSCHSEE